MQIYAKNSHMEAFFYFAYKVNTLPTTAMQLSMDWMTDSSFQILEQTVCNRKEMTSPKWNQRGALGMQNLIILIRIMPRSKSLFSWEAQMVFLMITVEPVWVFHVTCKQVLSYNSILCSRNMWKQTVNWAKNSSYFSWLHFIPKPTGTSAKAHRFNEQGSVKCAIHLSVLLNQLIHSD